MEFLEFFDLDLEGACGQWNITKTTKVWALVGCALKGTNECHHRKVATKDKGHL